MVEQARDPDIRVYQTIIGSRVRSQLAYRTSFWLNVTTSVAVGLVEFIELFAIMSNIRVFGGLDLRQVLLVFALANAGWALAGWFSVSSTQCRRTCASAVWRCYSSGRCP